jgi:hypothetical protein
VGRMGAMVYVDAAGKVRTRSDSIFPGGPADASRPSRRRSPGRGRTIRLRSFGSVEGRSLGGALRSHDGPAPDHSRATRALSGECLWWADHTPDGRIPPFMTREKVRCRRAPHRLRRSDLRLSSRSGPQTGGEGTYVVPMNLSPEIGRHREPCHRIYASDTQDDLARTGCMSTPRSHALAVLCRRPHLPGRWGIIPLQRGRSGVRTSGGTRRTT